MKIIYNKLIPFKGYKAINLFGYVFVRDYSYLYPKDVVHEKIHTKQMKELGYIFFYIIYLFEWLVRLMLPGNAYRNISFEKEAYAHQDGGAMYLMRRKHYAQWRKP